MEQFDASLQRGVEHEKISSILACLKMDRKRCRVGFDFLAIGQQHHSYHVGMIRNGIVDNLVLDISSRFESPYWTNAECQVICYAKRSIKLVAFLRDCWLSPREIHIIGTPTRMIPIWLLISGWKRPRIHLHGQIGTIATKSYLCWRLLAFFCEFIVANPIYSGPKIVKSIGRAGFFAHITSRKNNKNCLIYGANKEIDEVVIRRLREAGYAVQFCKNPTGAFVDINLIVSSSSRCQYAFIKAPYEHYSLSPSGRIADLFILSLDAIVLSEDKSTQATLTSYGISYVKVY
jgi:hypothetical protein